MSTPIDRRSLLTVAGAASVAAGIDVAAMPFIA